MTSGHKIALVVIALFCGGVIFFYAYPRNENQTATNSGQQNQQDDNADATDKQGGKTVADANEETRKQLEALHRATGKHVDSKAKTDDSKSIADDKSLAGDAKKVGTGEGKVDAIVIDGNPDGAIIDADGKSSGTKAIADAGKADAGADEAKADDDAGKHIVASHDADEDIASKLLGGDSKAADAGKSDDLPAKKLGERSKTDASADADDSDDKRLASADGDAEGSRSIFDHTADSARDQDIPETYTVQENDTLSDISYKFYGTARHWPEIEKANPGIVAQNIKPGDVIKLPRRSELPQAKPTPKVEVTDAPAGSTIYTVKAGQTLWHIAKDHYGNGGLWQFIYEHNKKVLGDNPNHVREGMRLILPPAPRKDQ